MAIQFKRGREDFSRRCKIKPRRLTLIPTQLCSRGASGTSRTIGHGFWTELKRVAIPAFSGNKKLKKIGKKPL